MAGRVPAVAVFVLAGTLVGCGGTVRPANSPPLPEDPHRVVIYDYQFNPPRLTVPAGTKVTWVNMDLIHHTATSSVTAAPFDSRHLLYKSEYSYTFDRAGEYAYICVPHPGMKGTIVVE
jgi:plastocyanin